MALIISHLTIYYALLLTMSYLLENFTKSLYSSSRAWGVEIARRIRPSSGLSQAAWFSIAAIAGRTQPPSQIELAKELNIEAASMVAMIDRLVSLGIVERQPSAADRRVKNILLTAQGLALYQEVKEQARLIRQDILGSIDPQKLQIAIEVMQELQANIEQANQQNNP